MQETLVGLIPAAGEGSRLGLPYPKELQPLIKKDAYKPAAQFAVESITHSGGQHVVFVINEKKHQLIGHFGSGERFDCDFSYVVQEKRRPMGPARSPGLADALDAAYHLVRGQTVLFAMADTILRPHNIFARMLEAAQPTDDLILGLFEVDRPQKFGMVDLDDQGVVRRIVDKPAQTDLKLGWGCIAWRPKFTEHLRSCVRERNMGDFAEIMNLGIENGLRGRGFSFDDGYFADMGTFEELLEAEAWYRGQPEP